MTQVPRSIENSSVR